MKSRSELKWGLIQCRWKYRRGIYTSIPQNRVMPSAVSRGGEGLVVVCEGEMPWGLGAGGRGPVGSLAGETGRFPLTVIWAFGGLTLSWREAGRGRT